MEGCGAAMGSKCWPVEIDSKVSQTLNNRNTTMNNCPPFLPAHFRVVVAALLFRAIFPPIAFLVILFCSFVVLVRFFSSWRAIWSGDMDTQNEWVMLRRRMERWRKSHHPHSIKASLIDPTKENPEVKQQKQEGEGEHQPQGLNAASLTSPSHSSSLSTSPIPPSGSAVSGSGAGGEGGKKANPNAAARRSAASPLQSSSSSSLSASSSSSSSSASDQFLIVPNCTAGMQLPSIYASVLPLQHHPSATTTSSFPVVSQESGRHLAVSLACIPKDQNCFQWLNEAKLSVKDEAAVLALAQTRAQQNHHAQKEEAPEGEFDWKLIAVHCSFIVLPLLFLETFSVLFIVACFSLFLFSFCRRQGRSSDWIL